MPLQSVHERKIMAVKIKVKNWEDFIFATGSSISATEIRTPIEHNVYNQSQIVFDKDGYVWAVNSKGMVPMYKHCPVELMAEIYFQKIKEMK